MNYNCIVDSTEAIITNDDLSHMPSAILNRSYLKVSEDDFFLDVFDTAQYRVQSGNRVLIHPYEHSDESSVNLFLQSSVTAALLHQRTMLPFHGNTFEFEGKGIAICGQCGSGKSSISAAFCQNGASLINDDISPVNVSDKDVTITSVNTRFKLWSDALMNLEIESNQLDRIRPMTNKFYLPSTDKPKTRQKLNHIFILSTHSKTDFIVNELNGIDKYIILHNCIYRKLYLRGMPPTEKIYLKQLFKIASSVKIAQIGRPYACDIYDAMNVIRKEIIK